LPARKCTGCAPVAKLGAASSRLNKAVVKVQMALCGAALVLVLMGCFCYPPPPL
jgi:hypothetical protein